MINGIDDYLRIDVLKFIFGALLLAGAAIASSRLRSSRSNWASTQPGPCFATVNMGWKCFPIPKARKQSASGESSSSQSQQQSPEVRASASRESRPKRTGLFKVKLSNRSFITQQRWEPWEELQSMQSL